MMTTPLLQVKDLRIAFRTNAGLISVVDGVTFSVAEGETLGIVGESGSGKSVTCLSILGLLENAEVSGEIWFRGQNLLALSPAGLRALRGSDIGIVFQDPLASLNPFHRIGWQLVEAIQAHGRTSRRDARSRAVELLGQVGIPHPAQRLDDWPHQFSGGMRQRVMIAMALANHPALLIGDEPTTALDVSVQAQIIELLQRLGDELGIAVILVTHNLGVVAQIADRVMVMYAGRVVETGSIWEIFRESAHPYTWGLLSSVPSLTGPALVSDPAARLRSIGGLPPSPAAMPPGCRFHPRCAFVMDVCRAQEPVLRPADGPGHQTACHLPDGQRAAARAEAMVSGDG
ncbi:MAG TPA: ABC transporter ATP-binding protein [Streptosporangiaceae bacterium]|nr:ABC transporter ATP-binding protein [Streptosporangiaceae bacterium]